MSCWRAMHISQQIFKQPILLSSRIVCTPVSYSRWCAAISFCWRCESLKYEKLSMISGNWKQNVSWIYHSYQVTKDTNWIKFEIQNDWKGISICTTTQTKGANILSKSIPFGTLKNLNQTTIFKTITQFNYRRIPKMNHFSIQGVLLGIWVWIFFHLRYHCSIMLPVSIRSVRGTRHTNHSKFSISSILKIQKI